MMPPRLSKRGCSWGRSAVPPAPACRGGCSGAPRDTGPGPRRRATRTCRTASPAPETHRTRRWKGGSRPASRFERCPPPPRGTSGMRSASAAGPSVKRYRRAPPRRGSPMANRGRPRRAAGCARTNRRLLQGDVTRSAAAGADGGEAIAQREACPGVPCVAVKPGLKRRLPSAPLPRRVWTRSSPRVGAVRGTVQSADARPVGCCPGSSLGLS